MVARAKEDEQEGEGEEEGDDATAGPAQLPESRWPLDLGREHGDEDKRLAVTRRRRWKVTESSRAVREGVDVDVDCTERCETAGQEARSQKPRAEQSWELKRGSRGRLCGRQLRDRSMIGSVKGVRAAGKALGRQGWAGLPPLAWGG